MLATFTMKKGPENFQMALTFFLSREYWNTGSKRCEIGVQLNYTYYASQVSERENYLRHLVN